MRIEELPGLQGVRFLATFVTSIGALALFRPVILSGIAVLFDVLRFGGTGQAIATIPEFVLELSLGIYLTARGIRLDAPILDSSRAAPARA